jgi:hypothetical protein
VQLEALVLLLELPQLLAEDHVVLVLRRVDQHDVLHLVAVVQRSQHRHDRRDPAAGTDEQQLVGDLVGEREVALHAAQADDRPHTGLVREVGRDLALVDVLDRDRDDAFLVLRVARQRVGAPVAAALDVDPDAQELPGLVAVEAVARLDDHRARGLRLRLDPLDLPAQLARRPERVDQLQVVVWEQGRGERSDGAQCQALDARDVGASSLLSHEVEECN